MTWEIVTGLIVLVGCAISVGTIVYKLANILTKLESAIQSLRETISLIKSSNANDHERIFESIENFEKRLTDIEIQVKCYMTGNGNPPVASH